MRFSSEIKELRQNMGRLQLLSQKLRFMPVLQASNSLAGQRRWSKEHTQLLHFILKLVYCH
jgi:hypothetical protein